MPTKVRMEFKLAVAHKPGELARVLETFARGGVNVLAFIGYTMGEGAYIHVVPDNDQKAKKALAAGGYNAETGTVACVTSASGKGAGAKLAAKLGKAGINIEHAYATTSGSGRSTAVFRVSDAAAAVKALK